MDNTISEIYGEQKPVMEKDAIQLLKEIKKKKLSMKTENPMKIHVLEIKKFIDEINEFLENNKFENTDTFDFNELFLKINKTKKVKHIEV